MELSLLQVQDEGRSKVRSSLTPSTAQLALKRILPFPCKSKYTVVILMPKSSTFKLLKSVFQSARTNYGKETKVSYIWPLVGKLLYAWLEVMETTIYYIFV